MLLWSTQALVKLADSLKMTVDEIIDSDRKFEVVRVEVREANTEGRE